MVQLPTISEADTRDAFVAMPLDDYELLDFGGGSKLERDIAVMFMVDMSGSDQGLDQRRRTRGPWCCCASRWRPGVTATRSTGSPA